MNIVVAVLILGLIIIIHELGHFLLAKKNGIVVTEFSVGMGPRLASFVKNGTRYSLKILPIGGSCMMLGEDEADTGEGSFNSKGVGARFSVIFAGAFFNFILAFVLALIVLGSRGVDLPKVSRVAENSTAREAGLREGDWIREINGTTIHLDREIYAYFYFHPLTGEPMEVTFEREGEKQTVTITPQEISSYLLGCTFTSIDEPAELVGIEPGYPLEAAGLQVGDQVVAINGTPIETGSDLAEYLKQNPLNGDTITLSYRREGVDTIVDITPKLYTGYDMGWDIDMLSEKVSVLNVIKYSFYELKYNIVNTIKSLMYLITGKVSVKEVSGPVGIVNFVGDVVSETKDYGIGVTLLSLADFCILLSANLGVMNLLPIPALDGGRLVFILIEAVRGKPIAKEKEAMVHTVGMALLMLFMIFVFFNDIRNIFG